MQIRLPWGQKISNILPHLFFMRGEIRSGKCIVYKNIQNLKDEARRNKLSRMKMRIKTPLSNLDET